jgi:hypothetical protein
MPSPPTPTDDEAADRADDVESTPAQHDARPNFWLRRVVVVGGIVAVFATAALVVAQVIETSSAENASGSIDDDWDRVVLVDQRTGRVTVDDDQGEEVSRIETGLRSVTSSRTVAGTTVLTAAAGAVVVDLDAEEATDIELADGTIAQPSGSALTMILAPTGGASGLLVHGPSGDVLDTDSFAPIPGTRFEWDDARSDPSGRHVFVTDSGNFQSVLFSFERDEPTYVPGLALAVDDRVIVTAQNVGAEATINVFDHDGSAVSSGTAPSVRTALISGESVHLVTVDGEVVTMATTSGETGSSESLGIGAVASGTVSTDGERLIVSGSDGTAIVDDDGDLVGAYPGLAVPATPWATQGSTCVALADDAAAPASVTIVELLDGSIANEAEIREPLFASADGCTVASAVADGYQLVSPSAISTIDSDGELIGLSPDAAAVVLELDRRIVLDRPDADEPVDLGPPGRTVEFT